MLRELLRHMADRVKPERLIVAGFSSGGDVAMRLCRERGRVRIDGVLSLGCNLSLDTCFLTRVVARFKGSDPTQMLAGLRTVGEGADSVADWLNVHSYLVNMLAKFQTQIDPLRAHARDIVAPFEQAGDDSPFVEWYRQASEHVRGLRCVFEDDPRNTDVLRAIELRNLESHVLGEHYREGSIVVEPGASHFDLVKPEVVTRHLESLLADVQDVARVPA
jgi:pimeloyl-ACP methyl ester carboxylesterase